jgi:hypothetical protein
MKALRLTIVIVSLGQIAAGIACLIRAKADETGQFGFAVCIIVGGLGLIGQATWFLREVAIVANALLAVVFLPGLLSVIISFIEPPPGPGISPILLLITAAIVLGGAASAWALSKLKVRREKNHVVSREVLE